MHYSDSIISSSYCREYPDQGKMSVPEDFPPSLQKSPAESSMRWSDHACPGYSSLCHQNCILTLNEEMCSTGCWVVGVPAILIRERALHDKKMLHAAVFGRNMIGLQEYELPKGRCPRSYSPERMVGPLVPCLVPRTGLPPF